MLKEFKEFALRGNVVDLAVGIIIGTAFGKIVTSLLEDIFMPILSVIFGSNIDFSGLFIVLAGDEVPESLAAAKSSGIPVFAYGNFITIVLNFVVLAFLIFQVVRLMNKLKAKEPPAATPEDITLLREIRDNIKK